MNYFYDINVNFDEENLYEFYEWQKKDIIENIKKIPLHLVSSSLMKDFIKYKPIVEKEFLDKLLNKTENCEGDKIKYATILADSKTSLVVEFDDIGKTVCKSNLLLSDDLNIIEIVKNIKKTNINYTVKKGKNRLRTILRQEAEIKKILNIEIESLYQNNEHLKLKYLYYEWLNKEENNLDEIYKNLKQKIKEELNEKTFKIYELIKLSYKTNR